MKDAGNLPEQFKEIEKHRTFNLPRRTPKRRTRFSTRPAKGQL